ncbi:PREDICTED: nucleobindin-2 isoform X2 [Rhagoletis zephyria]|uniref:nucleobindin-2 isoform X1 n=2 Tax=Rhagoletis TaxID=28609 RepID=UPI000811537E|nr:PREDICTED: nucleobindin-2 isoform X1 [Rhagoletis zephyria]XP_017481401.1 PREDICTED: nucleobindin-2 isoform X2 [Rhagoletis zephyria]XP_017481402.1 PREDICTED: nucleobindin-2 isoform X2 [Rhagoletis zephyria]
MRLKTSLLLIFVTTTVLYQFSEGLPVTKNKKGEKEENPSVPATPDVETALEYERYLKEVVEALESDPEFRKKLDKAPEADIRSGKIAQELEYVNHHVRSKLDEIKREEVERLRKLVNKEFELENDIDRDHLKVLQHLDHHNEHTFEIEDLKKLIKKTSEDLAEADRKRRAEFKEYEMQKEFEKETKIKNMTEEQRKQFEQEEKEKEEKHKKHEKVHHPGNKAQLEDVWEKQDQLDRKDFDPHTFFAMHDMDGNGYWDEVEVKALFVKELDKVYQSGLPEDDMRERAEEMERMREHVFEETDSNRDGLISYQEFLEQTKREEFNKDPEWETVDKTPQYTHEEYLEFERRRQEEIQRMIANGVLPPHPNMPQGYYPNGAHDTYQVNGQHQLPVGQQQYHYQQPQQQHLQQQQQYAQQQQQYQQYPQQQFQGQPVHLNPNQVYQTVGGQQQHYQQAPQQQYQQLPQQQNQQVPQQQYQQAPQQQQVPKQQQYQQVPQQQQQPQQQPAVPNQQAQQQQQYQQVPKQQQQPQQQQQPAVPNQQAQPQQQQPQQAQQQVEQPQMAPRQQPQPADGGAQASVNTQQQNIPPKY